MAYFAVRLKGTDRFLTMSKLEPGTSNPVTGPETQAWIADSKEQAWAQALLLDRESPTLIDAKWEAVEVLPSQGSVM